MGAAIVVLTTACAVVWAGWWETPPPSPVSPRSPAKRRTLIRIPTPPQPGRRFRPSRGQSNFGAAGSDTDRRLTLWVFRRIR